MPRDLEGLLVVALEQAVAAPYASSRLADSGARVIKLERAEGDFARRYDDYVNGLSAYFVWLNRGKESIRFDLKDRDDLALLHRLLSKADVFIQNLAPGATDRAGIGSADLRARYPRLITCDITGYGSSGPYRDMKAYDLLIQAESGLSLLTGNEHGPARVGVSVGDIACGMYAHQAITQALYARQSTHQGRGIEVSLFHSLGDWMNVPYLQFRYGAHEPSRSGLQHPTIAPYGVFECRDGQGILLSIQNEREWAALCRAALKRPELFDDPRFARNLDRVQHRAALDAIINETFRTMDRDDVAAGLLAAGIAFGNLSNMADVQSHPQQRFITVATSEGPVDVIAPPAVIPGSTEAYGRVPTVGEHDGSIRDEFAPALELAEA